MPVLSGQDVYSQMCAIRADLLVSFATGYAAELPPESHSRGRCGLPAEAIFFTDPRSSHSEHARQHRHSKLVAGEPRDSPLAIRVQWPFRKKAQMKSEEKNGPLFTRAEDPSGG